MKECKWFQVCPLKDFWEQNKLERKWIERYCKGNWKKCKRFQAVEKGLAHDDCMLPNGKIDKSLLE